MFEQALEQLDVEKFWRDGYAILHDAYSPDEIEAIRQDAYDTKPKGGDLLANERTQHLLTDGRMIKVARKLLGVEDILYGGDSSITINGTQRGWHKDNTDRLDGEAPDWDSRYTQLRFGIYAQDHVTHTGGLNLKIGSHDKKNLTEGETLYVKTRPGDLAVWSMRITHSGNGMLLKDPQAAYPEPKEQEGIAPEDVAPADGDRIAIFAHLGADDSHGHRYLDYLKTRTYMVKAWRMRPYSDAARQAAKDAGLTLRDLPAEVMDDPNAGLSELWAPFPYEKTAPAPKPAPTPVATPTAPSPSAPTGAPAAGNGSGDAAQTAKRVARVGARRAKGALKGAVRGWRNS